MRDPSMLDRQAAYPDTASAIRGCFQRLDVPRGAVSGFGIDVVDIAWVERALSLAGDRFARRVLTAAELAYAAGRPDRVATRLAAKEAVAKALGTGIRGVGWRDIEIVTAGTGRPLVRLSGRGSARADDLQIDRVLVALCHEGELAVAAATAHGAGGQVQ